jgi:cation transport ATPase
MPAFLEAKSTLFCLGFSFAALLANRFGAFDMKAEKVGEDNSLQRMIRLVESADAGKARIVGVADR